MARTAVVAGTATAVVGGVRGHQQNKAAQAQQAAAAPAPAAEDQSMQELEKLADMHGQGLLSDEEFAAAKSKLLGL